MSPQTFTHVLDLCGALTRRGARVLSAQAHHINGGRVRISAREATRAQERAHWRHMIEVARQRAAEMDAQAERASKLGGHGRD